MQDLNIDKIVLKIGSHSADSGNFCVMELTSFIAREKWSDSPACVSPAIAAFLRSWNDSLDDDTRQKLKPYSVKVVGTVGTDEDELTRSWLATDWLCRTFAPAWLQLAGLKEHADALAGLPPMTDDASAQSAQNTLSAAYSAARSAARLAADSAAYSAARSAARSAAGLAARSAALSAAGLAAYSAALSAAGLAAGSALQSTAITLQASAFELLDRMISVTAQAAR